MIYSMICYTSELSINELEIINLYWEFDEDRFPKFKHPVPTLDNYRNLDSRPVYSITKDTTLVLYFEEFTCSQCSGKIPVSNRLKLWRRLKYKGDILCQDCEKDKKDRDLREAKEEVNKFKENNFPAVPYLENMSYFHSLCLLSLVSQKNGNDKFIGDSPSKVDITFSESIDQQVVNSLINIRALVYINEVPAEVEAAYELLHGDFRKISYYKNVTNNQYRRPSLVPEGVYLNSPILEDGNSCSDLNTLLYSKIIHNQVSIEDIQQVKRVVKGIQFAKIYQLISEVSHEYNLRIADSNVLRALLEHISDKYPPNKLYFTFRMKAKDVIVYLHQNKVNPYAEQHYFANAVSSFIEYVEGKDQKLIKSWAIPATLDISPLEALFSQIYLTGEFNFNRLSTEEVVSKWLEKVEMLLDNAHLNSI